MAENMRTLAIIPARGGSKRVPGKNRRDFAGTPLVAWSIRFAKSVPWFSRVIVSTDDDAVADIAASENLPVPFTRPADLSGDTATSVAVACHALDFEAAAGREYDLVALLQPTSPVRLMERWEAAYALIADPGVDSVVGLAPARSHPYHTYSLAPGGGLAPFVAGGDELRKQRSQDLPPAHCLAGNLYLTRSSVLREKYTFFPPRTAGVGCDKPFEAMDIDTEEDWVVAETLTRYFRQQPWPLSS